jgi:hypothetical protein
MLGLHTFRGLESATRPSRTSASSRRRGGSSLSAHTMRHSVSIAAAPSATLTSPWQPQMPELARQAPRISLLCCPPGTATATDAKAEAEAEAEGRAKTWTQLMLAYPSVYERSLHSAGARPFELQPSSQRPGTVASNSAAVIRRVGQPCPRGRPYCKLHLDVSGCCLFGPPCVVPSILRAAKTSRVQSTALRRS